MFSASLYSFQPFRAPTYTHTHADSYSALASIGCSQRDGGLNITGVFDFFFVFLFPEIPRSMSRLLSFSASFLHIPSACRFIHFYNLLFFFSPERYVVDAVFILFLVLLFTHH